MWGQVEGHGQQQNCFAGTLLLGGLGTHQGCGSIWAAEGEFLSGEDTTKFSEPLDALQHLQPLPALQPGVSELPLCHPSKCHPALTPPRPAPSCAQHLMGALSHMLQPPPQHLWLPTQHPGWSHSPEPAQAVTGQGDSPHGAGCPGCEHCGGCRCPLRSHFMPRAGQAGSGASAHSDPSCHQPSPLPLPPGSQALPSSSSWAHS